MLNFLTPVLEGSVGSRFDLLRWFWEVLWWQCLVNPAVLPPAHLSVLPLHLPMAGQHQSQLRPPAASTAGSSTRCGTSSSTTGGRSFWWWHDVWPDGFYDVWHGCWYRHGCGQSRCGCCHGPTSDRGRSSSGGCPCCTCSNQPASVSISAGAADAVHEVFQRCIRMPVLHGCTEGLPAGTVRRQHEVIRALAVESALEILLPRRRLESCSGYFREPWVSRKDFMAWKTAQRSQGRKKGKQLHLVLRKLVKLDLVYSKPANKLSDCIWKNRCNKSVTSMQYAACCPSIT